MKLLERFFILLEALRVIWNLRGWIALAFGGSTIALASWVISGAGAGSARWVFVGVSGWFIVITLCLGWLADLTDEDDRKDNDDMNGWEIKCACGHTAPVLEFDNGSVGHWTCPECGATFAASKTLVAEELFTNECREPAEADA